MEVLSVTMTTLYDIQSALEHFDKVDDIVITNNEIGEYVVDFTHKIESVVVTSTLTLKG